jgi:hypothetical protein
MTRLQESRLFDAIWDAFNPPSGLRPDRLCRLCGWPAHPAFRGRSKAHQVEPYGTICGRCNAVPNDTWEALKLLCHWRDADDVHGRRATIDEVVQHIRGAE